MSTLSESGFPNLMDWLKRRNPDMSIADIANVMSKKNDVIDDIPWVEGNLPTGHQITQATALITPQWRRFNAGITASKSETEQYVEVCGMMEDESKVDVDVAKLHGDPLQYRETEDRLKKEAFAQAAATALFYESASSNPERVHGLAPRYAATTGLVNSSYVMKSSSPSGVNCRSIWLINWSPDHVFGIFPKGSMMGLQVKDEGVQRIVDPNTSTAFLRAYLTHFQWKMGFAVKDYRYVVRFQYDPDNAECATDEKGLFLGMQDMLNLVYDLLPSARFYMDRTTKTLLDRQLAANHNKFLDYVEAGKRRIPTYMGVPIRVTDALVAETAIS